MPLGGKGHEPLFGGFNLRRAKRPAKSEWMASAAKERLMKGPKGYMDLGNIFDEIFEAARDFHDEFRRSFDARGNDCRGNREDGRSTEDERTGRGWPGGPSWIFDDNTDYYPNYSYPPMNVFMTSDRNLIFEFALAGFDEKDISLSFQGDYMVFSASMPQAAAPHDAADDSARSAGGNAAHPEENVRYFKRRLKMKDIEKQKYFVPLDKYAQDKVKAAA